MRILGVLQVIAQVTDHCNTVCIMCYIHDSDEAKLVTSKWVMSEFDLSLML